MADLAQVLKLLRRVGVAAAGPTGAQEALGLAGLAKNAVTGNASNIRLGPNGEVMYDSRDPAAAASAMGSFVRTDPAGAAADPDVVKHELRHVAQSDVMGPAYLPAAIFEGAEAVPYGSGMMERDAIRHSTPQSEMLRQGSSMYQKPRQAAGEALLRGLLGR